MVTPYYNKCTQQGLIRHYTYIADRVSTPVIVYNVPARTGFNIAPETYAALSEHKNIVAVKEANGDLSALAKTVRLCGGRLDVYSGNDDQTAVFLALGAKGVISVAANVIPKTMHEMATNTRIAADLQIRYLDLINALFAEVNPIPVKAALEMMRGKRFPLRLPLTGMTDEKRIVLKTALQNHGLI